MYRIPWISEQIRNVEKCKIKKNYYNEQISLNLKGLLW